MNYTKHKDNPKSFRALTGLTHIQYSHLLPYFEAAHDDYLSDYEMNAFVDNIFATCAALHNLRIKMKPWTYKY